MGVIDDVFFVWTFDELLYLANCQRLDDYHDYGNPYVAIKEILFKFSPD